MAGVNALVAKLERLAAHEVIERIANKVRDTCQEQCLAGFREQRNPYGEPWAPIKRGGHPILDKSGDMIDNLTTRAAGPRVIMRTLGYAVFAQKGTEHAARTSIKSRVSFKEYKTPPRMIFPDPARGLGLWRDPIEKASVEAIRELMR